jgi:hypothetical protein
MATYNVEWYFKVNNEVLPSWPVSTSGFELPIKFGISFPNAGPLHLDLAEILIEIEDSGKPLLKIGTPGNMVIKNVLEGGNDNQGAGNPTHGEFHVTFPFSDLNPLTILNLIKHLLSKSGTIAMNARFIRDKLDIKWVEDVVHQLGETGVAKTLIPFVGVALAHIKFEVIGLNLDQTRVYKEIVKLVEKWVLEHYPQLGSSMPSVGENIPEASSNSTMAIAANFGNTTLHPRGLSNALSFRIRGH